MFILQKIFSPGALFQAEAVLTVAGTVTPFPGEGTVTGTLEQNGAAVLAAVCPVDDAGRFTLTFLNTPAASFDPWTLVLTFSGSDEVLRIDDILFGELWLASGQSNMELPNVFMNDRQAVYDSIREKHIRVFAVDTLACNAPFPKSPDYMTGGHWIDSANTADLDNVSGLGIKFCEQLYHWLNQVGDVPVGFLNASYGGTPMPAWFPRDAVDNDPYIKGILERIGLYPTDWNNRGDTNFQQPFGQYHAKIACLEGARVRGVIWYQGENETGGAYWQKAYADYLRFYHKIYAERFAADPEHFFMLSTLIYPWTYGGSGECNVGYINDAFVTTAVEEPGKFMAAPIGDLPPSWAFAQGNHPIHPTNKYPLAVRMANLALDNVYERNNAHTAPAHLADCTPMGGKLRLTFDSVGFGLYLDGEKPLGLYVAGEDNIYLPAECEILDECTMDVWCDAIPEPKNAAYAIQSLEPCCNLWAGLYPIYPFFTDKETYLNMEARPWYDTSRTSMWGSKLRGDILDLFYRPIWHPTAGSEVCPDIAFTKEGQSLRVAPEEVDGDNFGCYVKSYPYNRLDLQKFGKLSVNLYHVADLTATLTLTWAGGEATFPLEQKADAGDCWFTYEAILTGLPAEAEIQKMTFGFQQTGNIRFVNLEKVRLWK